MDTNHSLQNVFVGIDVHRYSYMVVCIAEDTAIKRCRMPADPQCLVQFLEKTFPGSRVHSAYEAGFSGFVLHRLLVASGIDSIVVHPASIEVSSRDRVKTDKRDANKIALHLAGKRLKAIRVPSEEEELRRLITRTRDQLVRNRARLKNQVRMKLLQFGLLDVTDRRPMSSKLVEEILARELPADLRITVDVLYATWCSIDEQVKRLSRRILQQAQADPLEKVYRSLPGCGPLAARVLANELGDLRQFPNERRLFSFTGLTPAEFSSGDSTRRGHISRQGPGRIRHILVEAAWLAIRQDTRLEQDFHRITKRAGKKRAIVAIARKLIGRARAIMRSGAEYERGLGIAA